MGNPRTRTTKTLASLVIVARLARHVRESGRPALILTPSSGNKETALRDAVLRAHEHGLASADELRIVAVVPDAARPKLWSSPLDAEPLLCARNPVAVVGGDDRVPVKELALAAAERCAAELRGADPTFYTRRPSMSAEMNRLIRDRGGGGIVVSLHECLQRYAEVGELLAAAGVDLARDPRRLREWSLVMAVTGVLNAIGRGLVVGEDVLVHSSGSYADWDFTPMPAGGLCPAAEVDGVCRLVPGAAA